MKNAVDSALYLFPSHSCRKANISEQILILKQHSKLTITLDCNVSLYKQLIGRNQKFHLNVHIVWIRELSLPDHIICMSESIRY